jgi:hypothetical protein
VRKLLLLGHSNVHPYILSYIHIYGQHNYGVELCVPIGMDLLVHNKSQCRHTFAEHFRKGFVCGTSFKHYQGWKMWMVNTRATRICATVFHKHKYIFNPMVTSAEAVVAAAKNLAKVLKGKLPHYLHSVP